MDTWPVHGLKSILWLTARNLLREKTSFDSCTQTTCASDCKPKRERWMLVTAQTAAVWQSCSRSSQAQTRGKINPKMALRYFRTIQTWRIMAWNEEKIQSDSFWWYLQPWQMSHKIDHVFICNSAVKAYMNPHSTANPLNPSKNTPCTLARLTPVEASHQEGPLFAPILPCCMCEWQGSCTVVSPWYYSPHWPHCEACEIWISAATEKQTGIPTRVLGDIKPLCLLNLTTFLYSIFTAQGKEMLCSRWRNQSTLQSFCLVLMTGLGLLSWPGCPCGEQCHACILTPGPTQSSSALTYTTQGCLCLELNRKDYSV